MVYLFGRIKIAFLLFDEIADPNFSSYKLMIRWHKNDCGQEGLVLFNRMRDGLVEGNEYTFMSVVTACEKLGASHQGKAFMDAYLIFDEFSIIDLVSWTAMIIVHNLGTKIGLDDASVTPSSGHDVIAWNSITSGYAQSGFANEALKLNEISYIQHDSTAMVGNLFSLCFPRGYQI
ncbi:pentatricopeptide repeat-containing protein At2g03380, mitochondrial-like [Olea europaea var. sylvestris]|uniref:pentatricopeptide repeat-containing protein At2g03380, mitochondrial-like n=1 Tax=Olea europaea var. sylvestris TaxID=158386 RepID=UPI000C1D5B36|nr:pentatricopeptide repeat-containing protein At2g03380, mitochondrial-like [Olea europaea var. sylvestris]